MPAKIREAADRVLFGPGSAAKSVEVTADQDLRYRLGKDGHRMGIEERSQSLSLDDHPSPAVTPEVAANDHHQTVWNPRMLQIRPLAGLAAICVTVVCVFASLIVLHRSDGQATTDWSLSPSTVLAIITAVSNSAVGLAHMEAIPISVRMPMKD